MTLRQYEAFLKTVECASVSAAAQALGVSQSALTQLLAGLERDCGFPLEQTKEFVKERCRTDHAFRQKTLHALQESGIDGWRPVHTGRGSFAITNEEE